MGDPTAGSLASHRHAGNTLRATGRTGRQDRAQRPGIRRPTAAAETPGRARCRNLGGPASEGQRRHWTAIALGRARDAVATGFSGRRDGGLDECPSRWPEGERRVAIARSTYYYDFPNEVIAHPFDNFEDLGPVRPLHLTRYALVDASYGYNMGTEIFQIPGYVVIRNEMIHETRSIPLDGRPHIGRDPPEDGRFARALGRRHAGHRDDELQRQGRSRRTTATPT